MTPTFIDISMIIGLDVTSSANPMSLNTKNQYDFKTKSIGGWSGYVAAYMGQGSVTPREHVAFLLMWLEKFLFCGSSCGPTTNWQFLAEALEIKRQFPLGKILLGYLYQMLSNASAKITVGSVVGAGGPWWLLQTWLNLIVMKVVNRPSVSEAEFPRLEPIVGDDGEERTHRRCTSYGEYASTPTDAGAKLSAELLKDWFCSFYESFQKDARVWFLYEDSAQLEHPVDFRFKDINHEVYQSSREIFSAAISPCILPVGIHQGRNIQASYEFYHPMSSARQLGMGQLPIGLFFADKIQCRGGISSTLMMDRLLSLQGPPLGSINNIELATFRSKSFDRWQGEWKLHLFHQPASMYMTDLFLDVVRQNLPLLIKATVAKTSNMPQRISRCRQKEENQISAVSIVSPIKKKKTKKTKPTDDLPTLDPSIEQALDEEVIEDEVDQAAAKDPRALLFSPPPSPSPLVAGRALAPCALASPSPPPLQPCSAVASAVAAAREDRRRHRQVAAVLVRPFAAVGTRRSFVAVDNPKVAAASFSSPSSSVPFPPPFWSPKKKTAVKKKSAATTSKPAPPPSPPPSPPVQQSSSDHTPLAAGSHHIEEEEQPAAPAIPVLADLFSFDIRDYLDEGEEDTTSKALAPLSDDVKKTQGSILDRLEASSLDNLVVDCGSIRAQLHEIQALILDELADILTPAVYLEQHQFKLEKAKLRLAERRERKDIEATIQANRQLVHEEKSKLDQLSEGPIKSNIDRLEARKIELLAQLEECNAELDMEHKKLADLPKSIEEQKARLKSAIKYVADLTKSLKVIPGTDA
uniref:Aminotransferase-like protein n=1 Tax=Oryza sativa subsp. japonica TaxID=39947 RepID=Q6K263_ORYSJ|nr:aminotransferase-like protein [Oryza sativa Japonica Group]